MDGEAKKTSSCQLGSGQKPHEDSLHRGRNLLCRRHSRHQYVGTFSQERSRDHFTGVLQERTSIRKRLHSESPMEARSRGARWANASIPWKPTPWARANDQSYPTAGIRSVRRRWSLRPTDSNHCGRLQHKGSVCPHVGRAVV